MGQEQLPDWKGSLIDEILRDAEQRLARERKRAAKRALQLAREQAYHRLAVAIERPQRTTVVRGQLTLWPEEPKLFDDAG